MSYRVRLLILLVCAGVGYFSAKALLTPPAPPLAQTSPPVSAARQSDTRELMQAELIPKGGSLLAEWDRLRAKHGSTAAEMPALYDEIKAIGDPFRQNGFRAALLAEWATLDPHGALAFLQKNDPGDVSPLMREWLRNDANAAVAALINGGNATSKVLRRMLGDIARVIPAQLAVAVSALPKPDSYWDVAAKDAFAAFAQKDLDAARSAAESVQGPQRERALSGVAMVWAGKDGPAALAWAEGLEEGETRNAALRAVMAGWAKTDPLAALEKVSLMPPNHVEGISASDIRAGVLKEAANKDLDGTLRWLRENPGKLGDPNFEGLQQVLSERLGRSPIATLQSLARSGVAGLDSLLRSAFLNAKAVTHSHAIWEWLQQQPDDDFTRSARSALLGSVAFVKPTDSLQFLEQLPNTPENREILERVTGYLIHGGTQMHQFEVFYEKASPHIRALLVETAFQNGSGFTSFDPALWVSRLDELKDLPADRRADAVGRLAYRWARSDPEKAIQWARSLQDPQQREEALGQAVYVSADIDPRKTATWVSSLPPGADRDVAASYLANVITHSDPQKGWTLAMSIQNPEKRLGSLTIAYTSMHKRDPAAARQMVKDAHIPATDKETLLKLSLE